MIKWEREHHHGQEEEKPILFAGDAESMHLMPERNTVRPVVMENLDVFDSKTG